jgi:hypothetical protein
MRKIADVLRLDAAGLSGRRISASLGIGRSCVGDYLDRAKAAGLSWPLPDGIDETALERRLFPQVSLKGRQSRNPLTFEALYGVPGSRDGARISYRTGQHGTRRTGVLRTTPHDWQAERRDGAAHNWQAAAGQAAVHVTAKRLIGCHGRKTGTSRILEAVRLHDSKYLANI